MYFEPILLVALLVLFHIVMIVRLLSKIKQRPAKTAKEPTLQQIIIFGTGLIFWPSYIAPVIAFVWVWVLEKQKK